MAIGKENKALDLRDWHIERAKEETQLAATHRASIGLDPDADDIRRLRAHEADERAAAHALEALDAHVALSVERHGQSLDVAACAARLAELLGRQLTQRERDELERSVRRQLTR